MSVFQEGDQIVVDDFIESGDSYRLGKSHICKVLVVGKTDLLLESTDSTYHPRVFTASKKCCRAIQKKDVIRYTPVMKPKINDLVVGMTSDYNGKAREMHIGTLQEIHHRNIYSKTAILMCGSKKVSISYDNLIVVESKK